MSKNIIIKGTLILTIAGLLTKLLGFYNRIFLTRLIGVKELGIYQLIFPVFMLAISICCQGISTALTKHISYYLAKKDHSGAKAIFFLGLCLSLSLSFIFATVIFNLSDIISIKLLKNPDCGQLLKIISYALPFIAIKSCINSYFLGDSNPKLQGLLHLTEQLIRVLSAYVIAYILPVKTLDATLATIAVVISEIFASILSIIIFTCKHINKTRTNTILQAIAFKRFLQDAVPITTNNLVFTLFSSLEAMILPAMLYKYYNSSDIAMQIYGMLTGIVIPFLLFPATVTTSLSTMLLPAITNAKATHNKNKINKAITYCILFCTFLGLITFIVYYIFGEFVCTFAFKSAESGIILRKMCFLCPFIYLSGVFSTILNGLDKAFYNMVINVTGLVIRIIITINLVPIHGFPAYIAGMIGSYIFIIIFMLYTIKQTKEKET